MDKQEELKQAVEALSDDDIEKLSGGMLVPGGLKIAKIVGMTWAGLIGASAVAASVVGIVGAVKHGDGGYYFKEGANKLSEKSKEIKSKIHSKNI
ncbi:MAG: hypothetical protein Q4D57_04950 [Clostridia bacterium]|nr:hypothetical protein [Clostridia bacterium]